MGAYGQAIRGEGSSGEVLDGKENVEEDTTEQMFVRYGLQSDENELLENSGKERVFEEI